jgi:hypothetical protein
MPDVQKYRVTQAASYETATPNGVVSHDFKPGDVTPKTDAEAAALEAMVSAGCAERVTGKATPPAPTKPAKDEE